ncbi:hypothetical protein L4Z68_001381 [Pseudomonas aeruginosa]|uniref:hypothetical protein n=1 Tax=Aquipseudomonas alcaligenes TaxID=43263 RepID=UPI001F1E1D2A|nr:hypothetical protein [Pseudomonas alcaligenes]EKU6307937.1 hypothetical protein [Pseudomonas aeruginosa]EKX2969388.1 hypothetical protein [Pseudomonas aeruginosa]BDC78333.1 hypothetical protein MRCP2_p0680 [Pseudomonas alcaligenes]HDV6123067.1 hypothetical protein [Pseudomonas aeruginosa]HDV6143945.1 hypothetical protein [Pseudomonas aeruginosa]
MPIDPLDELAIQAIGLWERLSGRKVGATAFSIQMTDASRELSAGCGLIDKAVALGHGLSVLLVVRSVVERMSGAGLLADYDQDSVSALARLFSSPACASACAEYFLHCERAISHYRGDVGTGDGISAFVRQEAALLNLDAFLAMQRLTRLQAFNGPPGGSVEPQLSQFVLAFQSIEQLLQHAREMPEGFSLCTILCESISDSYFVLLVRNGQRVTLLTDKGKFAHPLQQAMMRGRNDRYNQYRIAGSHFPYSLLGIVWADRGRRASAGTSQALELTSGGIPSIGSLADLAPSELLWLHQMIEQCRVRYFDQQVVEPQLALGSQIRLEHSWLPASSNSVPAVLEAVPPLEVRQSAELTTDFMQGMEPTWSNNRTPNRWMERRYAPLVPAEALYVPEAALDGGTLLLEHADTSTRLVRAGGALAHERIPTQVILQSISSDLLATAEEVARDAHYIARSNQAQVIKVLARQDFEARRMEMLEWFYRKAAKNLPNLLEALLTGDSAPFQLDQLKHQAVFDITGFRPTGTSNARKVSFEYRPARTQYPPRKSDGPSLAKALKLVHLRDLCVCCVLSNMEQAQVFVSVPVTNALDIANLTGIAWDKLPEELQYLGMPLQRGNSILERLDPLHGLPNPWNGFEPRYLVPVGLRGLKDFRKARGLSTPKADSLQQL